MADVSVTAANVLGTVSKTPILMAGATITAGEVVYLDTVSNTWKLALNSGTALQAGVGTRFGFALNGASSGQPLCVQEAGAYTAGGTLVLGTQYMPSTTAGQLAPITDLVSTNYITLLGIASSTTTLDMGIKSATGYVSP